MKILFVTSEAAPFIKTGGLADVAASLPKALADMGHDIRVILPLYSTISLEHRNRFEFVKHFHLRMPKMNQYVGIFQYQEDGVTYYFIDNEHYFARSGVYGYFDDGERFAYFCRAVLDAACELPFHPDIIHLNDWHTGPIAPIFKDQYLMRPEFQSTKLIFTIHNLKYQGIFPYDLLGDYLGLSDDYFTYDKLEHFGNVNFMKAGLSFADYITTVSKTYAEELRYAYYSEGLHSLLLHRSHIIRGIVNGIDYDYYDPKTDDQIFAKYDFSTIEQKKTNKVELQKLLHLTVDPEVALIAMVTRLVPNKGMDLLSFIFDELMEEKVQFVLLGNGDYEYEQAFSHFAARYQGRVSSNIFFSNVLAKKVYAASDMFLMPSRFEPCGLGQMIAMRYGSVPIVRETGGLKDTVQAYNRFTGEGTGFSFSNYNAHELLFTIKDALYYYRDQKTWREIVRQAMLADHSWAESAKQYDEVYHYVKDMTVE